MKFLLDTNSVIALLKGHEGFLDRMRRYRPADFGLPAIVSHELHFGAYKSRHVKENLARLAALRFEIVPFDPQDARAAGEVRAQLAALGTPIGPYDVLLAGQAMARSLVIVTRNLREFDRVRKLKAVNWEA